MRRSDSGGFPFESAPRLNLALTLETAGKVDKAIATYKTALDVYPNHLQSTQALARLQVKSHKPDEHTKDLLEEIALRGETQQWEDWARMQGQRLACLSTLRSHLYTRRGAASP